MGALSQKFRLWSHIWATLLRLQSSSNFDVIVWVVIWASLIGSYWRLRKLGWKIWFKHRIIVVIILPEILTFAQNSIFSHCQKVQVFAMLNIWSGHTAQFADFVFHFEILNWCDRLTNQVSILWVTQKSISCFTSRFRILWRFDNFFCLIWTSWILIWRITT